MEAGGGLVEDEKLGGRRFATDKVGGEFYALSLAAAKRTGGLAEFEVAETDVLQGLEADENGGTFVEELDGLVDGHVEHVGNVFAFVLNFESFFFEPCAVAFVAKEVEIGHELHAYGDVAFALAGFAAAAFGVEGEVSGFVATGFGERLVGEELAYLVVGFDVCGRVAAGGASDGVLVDEFYC